MKSGEIYLGTFIYTVTAGRSRALVEQSIESTFTVGDEESAWVRLEKRTKGMKGRVKIIPIKKIGFTNKKV